MQPKDAILAQDFCIHHNIELTLIQSFYESGLVEIIQIEEKDFLPIDQLGHLEKLVRLYNEMDINVEGIETINHLLQMISSMQKEIVHLSERLKIYESLGSD